MGAEFAGLNIALSSLYAQRRGLEVTGQNIANSNTEGYSRQRVTLNSVGGSVIPAVFSSPTGVGEGVRYSATERMRDSFLEMRSLTEHGALSQALTSQQVFARVEQAFGEPGSTGLQAQLGDYWNAWDDVANHPEDIASRAQLIQRAQTLVTGFQQAGAALATQWTATREQLSAVVEDINSTATSVAALNEAILAASRAGLSPNDLMDQRDLLVQKLADRTGVTTRLGDDGVVDVYLGGTALVRGSHAEALKVAGAGTFDQVTVPAAGPGSTVSIQWAKDGYPVSAVSGQTGGMLKALNDTLPSYRDGLNKIVVQLATDVNAVHTAGFDMNGAQGVDFFTFDPTQPPSTATLRLNVTDPSLIAASGVGDPSTPTPNHDGSNAIKLAELAGKGADLAYRKLIVSLGVESQSAQRRAEIQTSITARVDASRDADSGVNLDEEMTNMVAYQQAYNAAARFLTTVDEMLDTLIGRTGLVGR